MVANLQGRNLQLHITECCILFVVFLIACIRQYIHNTLYYVCKCMCVSYYGSYMREDNG